MANETGSALEHTRMQIHKEATQIEENLSRLITPKGNSIKIYLIL